MINRFKLWNRWRKRNLNGFIYHICVLFGIIHSPTFYHFCARDEMLDIIKKSGDL